MGSGGEPEAIEGTGDDRHDREHRGGGQRAGDEGQQQPHGDAPGGLLGVAAAEVAGVGGEGGEPGGEGVAVVEGGPQHGDERTGELAVVIGEVEQGVTGEAASGDVGAISVLPARSMTPCRFPCPPTAR